jgi:hypothetical protein
MNCPECNGKTAVVDRRGVKRRRKCLSCDHRFSTFEVLLDPRGEPIVAQNGIAEVKLDAPKPRPKKEPKPEMKMSVVKANASARRKIEELRELRELRELSDYDDDFNDLPERW